MTTGLHAESSSATNLASSAMPHRMKPGLLLVTVAVQWNKARTRAAGQAYFPSIRPQYASDRYVKRVRACLTPWCQPLAEASLASCPLVSMIPSMPPPSAMYARIKTIIAEARLDSGSGGYDSSSGGGSSPASPAASESDGSSGADELYPHDQSEFRRPHASPLSFSAHDDELDRDCCIRHQPSVCVLLDDEHHQRMLLLFLLPAFASPTNAAARAEALSLWLSEFDVAWVLDEMGATAIPRRELGTRRVFHLHLRSQELTPKKEAALGELAAASAGAMLTLVGAVAALEGSCPWKLLAALDLYAPLTETYPLLAVLFSWGPSHPVPAAAEPALAGLVDAARRCGRDLGALVRSHYPWQQMPRVGEVDPCVGFWMGYFRRMLSSSRVSLRFVLGDGDEHEDEDSPPGTAEGLVAELISCLEAVLEEKAAALASFPGLRQVFLLNNTRAVAAGSDDLRRSLPPEWLRVREERMEGHIRGYMDASWAPVVSQLARRRSSPSAFHAAFESACSEQRCWKVPDPALRGVLREAVSEYVVPAYRRYLEDHPEVEAPPGGTAEELEQQLVNNDHYAKAKHECQSLSS
ncbi:hypothetical protein HU200_033432 [Digitaria exilis]|uniref:Exocyst subunit Exo70 family protein n=1 Tax=Digitaria exilis TaxID=1010633 RepID=A0A835BSF2_9POAL|nr:hypothetical protein HU200_033432 [Digitaria exilis]CAB3483009.1 unnamed protein product [Digitaria exilis]